GFGHLLHLVVGDLGKVLGGGHQARVRSVDAVHVAVDLGALGAEGGGHGEGRGVGASAAEGGDLTPVAHALVASDDDHLAARQLVFDAVRPHLDDPRIEVRIVGDDPAL